MNRDATGQDGLLKVEGLKKHFPVRGGVLYRQVATVYAVDGVSFEVKTGETVGLVGESGCGKTTAGRTLLRLYDATAGKVWFEGQDVFALDKKALRALRCDMQMIFQDPVESLNPRHSVGQILEEPLVIHKQGSAAERKEKVQQLLEKVGLQASYSHRYPHEFSGGQRQRIGIARAIALRPKLVVCDEPVSALDVSIQSQVLNLLLELQEDMGLSYLFIAHDLAVVKHMSDHIAVMYLGKIVELTQADRLYNAPLHPYTRALIAAIPAPDPKKRSNTSSALAGDVPSPLNPPTGCSFHTRCPFVRDVCKTEEPILIDSIKGQAQSHQVACHFAGEI